MVLDGYQRNLTLNTTSGKDGMTELCLRKKNIYLAAKNFVIVLLYKENYLQCISSFFHSLTLSHFYTIPECISSVLTTAFYNK